MFKHLLATSILLFSSINALVQAYEITETQQQTAKQLIDDALNSNLGYEIVESLTTEVGPRLAGSEAEERAREWGQELGKELGFDRVSIEEFTMPYWERGELSIELTAPYRQDLVGTALGGSASSTENLAADIVYFRNVDEIQNISDNAIRDKIAFIDGDALVKAQSGDGYALANQRRRIGWQHAQRGGARALVVRSVGSEFHRFPHTGMMSSNDGEWSSIPVIAISNPDADHLRRLHGLGKELALSISSTAKWHGDVTSGNVVLDLVGSEKPDEIVLIGGHLDSWDLGTGAIDDGAGVAITTAAAALISKLPTRPKRTIRVVMFGAEEVGLLGAKAYAEKHKAEVGQIVLATESDFGADTIWRLTSNVDSAANPAMDAIGKILVPLGIIRGDKDVPWGGPDISPLVKLGVPVISLSQNGMDYFDLHHTPDDTLDKIDPDKLAQNIAAYAAVVYLAAELDVEFRSTESIE